MALLRKQIMALPRKAVASGNWLCSEESLILVKRMRTLFHQSKQDVKNAYLGMQSVEADSKECAGGTIDYACFCG